MSAPTPLLDFFRRGEAARDVRMLAAAGVIAPRALEQLSILVLLLDDGDPDVRQTALATIERIPPDALRSSLARPDVPSGVREFFADRGLFPADQPARADAGDDPLLEPPLDALFDPERPGQPDLAGQDEVPGSDGLASGGEGRRESVAQQLAAMGFSGRLRAAVRGSREARAILVRDPNKVIAVSVLSNPKVGESEVEGFSKMANVSDDVLRVIAANRVWLKNYGILVGLTRNPKTPIGLSLNLLARLTDRDLNTLSMDRNVPDPLRTAARRRIALGTRR